MLDVREVSKSFGRFKAVSDASFRLEPGEIAGLLGPNGAGKTTTIRMITGFLPPDRGGITVAGHDTVLASLAARRCLGYLPESAPLYPEMTPRSYLEFRARLYRMPRGDRGAAISRALERCWLGDVAQKRIGQLSKGYRQRVGLAASLLHDPRVLVLDEPTNALDPTQVRETRTLIADLAKDRVVLLSSHILAEVELVCSRVIVMIRGRVRADGTPASLLRSQSGTYHVAWKSAGAEGDQRVVAALRGVAGVAAVKVDTAAGSGMGDGRGMSVTVESGENMDLLGALGQVLHEQGVVVLTLARRAATLERVFVDLVHQAADEREAAA